MIEDKKQSNRLFFVVSETSALFDRAAFCQDVVIEYFGKAVELSFMEEYFRNDTRVAVSCKLFSRRTRIRVERCDDALLFQLQMTVNCDFIRVC